MFAQNREKLTPLVRKLSELAPPPPSLSVWTHHKLRKIWRFLHQKVRTSVSEQSLLRTGQTLLTTDVFYGRSLNENL